MANWKYQYCSTQNTATDTSPYFFTWQSNGECKKHCLAQGGSSFFVLQGNNCWCSDYAPQDQSDISECSDTCPGYPSENCGKADEFYVYVELNGNPSGTAGSSQPSSTKGSSSKSTTMQTSASTATDPPATTDTPSASQFRTVTEDNGSVRTVTLFQSSSPTSTSDSAGLSEKSSSNTGAIVGGVVGGIGALALILAVVFFLLWRRRKQQRAEQGGESGEPGVHRYASTMSKAGLLRTEKEPKYPPPIATSGFSSTKRHSRTLDQDSISPISASDRRNSSFRVDQRLNPSTLFVFDNTSRGSVGSLDDSRDYHRTLNVRNPDMQD
jgi:cell wall integrity and stress response component